MLVFVNLAEAQQPTKIPRIGYVSGTGSPSDPGPYVEALRQGLRDLGYVEGKSFMIEYRGAEGKPDRYPSLINELVRLKVDVLVAPTLPAILAASQATKTIPIVMVTNTEPVAAGLIDSLARPGEYHRALHALPRLKRKAAGIAYGSGSAALTCWSPSGCGQSKFSDYV